MSSCRPNQFSILVYEFGNVIHQYHLINPQRFSYILHGSAIRHHFTMRTINFSIFDPIFRTFIFAKAESLSLALRYSSFSYFSFYFCFLGIRVKVSRFSCIPNGLLWNLLLLFCFIIFIIYSRLSDGFGTEERKKI